MHGQAGIGGVLRIGPDRQVAQRGVNVDVGGAVAFVLLVSSRD
jgi:hypothetical protein